MVITRTALRAQTGERTGLKNDGLKIHRFFTREGMHPYDQLAWELRDAVIKDLRTGAVAFEQRDVEFPATWSMNATTIVAQKYFRGHLGTPERERSVRQMIDRVADAITGWGLKDGYFADGDSAEAFNAELKHLLVNQMTAFNSPVWFNVGVHATPQCSACQPYDALVSTPEGLVPIGALVERDAVGTKVFDAHGVTEVVATKHNGRKEVVRVHLKNGARLEVTGDHRVWRAQRSPSGPAGFVEAGTLQPGDRLSWHRTYAHGEREITDREVAEAALAGWLQSDGFVGQYAEGTNRSLTIEAMSVTPAELAWVTAALDTVFAGHHRHERTVSTQDGTLDCRRTRLYGAALAPFVDAWELRTRGAAMRVPAQLFTAPLPVVAAYLRSVFQAEGYVSVRERGARIGMDMVCGELVHGVQALLGRFGIFSRVRFKADRRADRQGCWSLSVSPLPDRMRFAQDIGFIDPGKAAKLAASLEMPGRVEHESKSLQVERVESRGVQDVYDIQTGSGEYLSAGLRVHNCFILSVDDTMASILNWYVEEGTIFKGGSGSGVNLSQIRSSKEKLKGGGTASGPVSFMRGADASAGTIKSGGTTRRAAKMVILDVDHPDIEEFIWCKQREEQKARVLAQAGFDMDLDGRDSASTQYQNANNSVRVTDEFMQAVIDDAEFHLRAVLSGEPVQTLRARELMREIAQAAWECADPGIQYDTVINDWHTTPNAGRINGSNPCCFVGNTLVLTTEGPVTMEVIQKTAEAGQELPDVLTRDRTSHALLRRPVVHAWVAGQTTRLVEVTLDGGAVVRCTPEHRFLATDGHYVEAQRLCLGAELVGIAGAVAVAGVVRITLDEPVKVYDIEVDGAHSFAVTSEGVDGGVVVHNSEYLHLDNSACNLASLNLRRFERDGVFDVEAFQRAVEITFLAQEIIVGNSSYPTDKIAANAHAYRQIGLGYANLGGLLMSQGIAYDSPVGRAWAGAITALMTGHAYRTSAEIAKVTGPFAGYADDAEGMLRVLAKHRDALATIDPDLAPGNILDAATESWDQANAIAAEHGVRNAQASVLAPTGTISFLLDCDTTGIEPDLGLVKAKKLVGGGTMRIVNQTVPVALEKLGYPLEQVEAIVAYVDQHSTIEGAPAFRPEHLPVFDCAMGERSISPMGHVNMLAAVQPFLSGAVSKTVNMPESATVEDIEEIYLEGWRLGLKALAIYRDNCKVGQPMAIAKKVDADAGGAATTEEAAQHGMIRRRLPKQRPSQTISFTVGDAEGYLTAGEYPGDGLGEIFVKLGKQGSTLSGVMDALAISVSLGLQYGVPLEAYVSKFINTRFEPSGMTDDADVRFATSIVDYIFRRLAIEYLPADKRAALGIFTTEERVASLDAGAPVLGDRPARTDATGQTVLPVSEPTPVDDIYGDAPYCYSCGVKMQRAGSCHVCSQCGTTSGCS